MSLPHSRNITLGPASSVPSALLDDLQDGEIGGRFGAQVYTFSSMDGIAIAGTFNRGTANGALSVLHPNGGGQLRITLKGLPVGCVITQVVLSLFGNGATDGSVSLKRVSRIFPSGQDIIATVNPTNIPAAWTPFTMTVPAPATTNGRLGVGEVAMIEFLGTTGPNFESANIEVFCFKD